MKAMSWRAARAGAQPLPKPQFPNLSSGRTSAASLHRSGTRSSVEWRRSRCKAWPPSAGGRAHSRAIASSLLVDNRDLAARVSGALPLSYHTMMAEFAMTVASLHWYFQRQSGTAAACPSARLVKSPGWRRSPSETQSALVTFPKE